MINTTATIAIKTVNHTHDREGNLIAFGIAEFYYRGKEGTGARVSMEQKTGIRKKL
ncbi:hypothetical protein [Scytonema sp. NUACC21]